MEKRNKKIYIHFAIGSGEESLREGGGRGGWGEEGGYRNRWIGCLTYVARKLPPPPPPAPLVDRRVWVYTQILIVARASYLLWRCHARKKNDCWPTDYTFSGTTSSELLTVKDPFFCDGQGLIIGPSENRGGKR